ncbi:hypothetical protein FHS16_004564 [Paenibacillus endophyticus]|uniref:HNH nuclease domain-containing protein n=1 Tax=Paenibacillus endophyticus TaxID=1294268 RepID=A0A7W5GCY5_9BACL|nr:HNH endonuclease signature motif containing protein [Paenibacillus endophyticus]MBB3154482.1 hypothetical protein [Paenibacillus endophyticus]
MRHILHERFSYSDSILLVSGAIQNFYVDNYSDFNMFWEIIRDHFPDKLFKSKKETILHEYLWWISNNSSMIEDFRNSDYSQEMFVFYENTLKDFDVRIPSKIIPNFEYIEGHGFCGKCKSCKKLINYVDWIAEKIDEFKPNIIHSAFHVLMLNKHFLRDFHERLAECIDRDKARLHQLHSEYILETGKIKRMSSLPVWLKRGMFFRDKGVCTICRNPLSGDLFLGIDPDMDHIVPLDKNGNNDPSNFQILCNKCNNKKRHYSSATSSYDIPYWNLPIEDQE